MTDSELTHRCEYCGTSLTEDGLDRGDVTHSATVCRERVYAALRHTDLELAAANARIRVLEEMLQVVPGKHLATKTGPDAPR